LQALSNIHGKLNYICFGTITLTKIKRGPQDKNNLSKKYDMNNCLLYIAQKYITTHTDSSCKVSVLAS